MPPNFKNTLAKQKADQTIQNNVKLRNLQLTAAQHVNAHSPGITAVNNLPLPQAPEQKYPVETISKSNKRIADAEFAHDIYMLHEFQEIERDSVQLFSDGIYRVLKIFNGAIIHFPVYVRSA